MVYIYNNKDAALTQDVLKRLLIIQSICQILTKTKADISRYPNIGMAIKLIPAGTRFGYGFPLISKHGYETGNKDIGTHPKLELSKRVGPYGPARLARINIGLGPKILSPNFNRAF
ncbi:hypothetical protein MTR_6g090040 [Medicago truncatula]|uniref:Uncharacterized protein n=1 Tax=Medicago truncatula TaxID=3880 RepID=G7KQH8_MEDTR|nr:hypothetical protein MTR_6g090040 [Medicago truncatula]